MSSSLCDACGLPPKPNQRLLNCTRCNSVKYHNSTCQRKHYPQHKKICRQKAAEREKKRAAVTAAEAAEAEPLVECQSLTGKGRSLVAASALSVGCRPLAGIKKDINNKRETREDGLCAPIVPPTLIESMRTTRCTYCFQLIDRTNSSPTNVLHVHCSMECRNLDRFWKKEQIASMKLISSRKISSMPSPTVLMCCRILAASLTNPAVMAKYNELCHNEVDDNYANTEQGRVHLNIITQCHHLLLAMGDISAAKLAHDLIEPSPILAFQFISRLSMNGFSICNAEQKALGVGVYPTASMINHSCRPNAVQTFWLSGSSEHHYPPMLQITMCRDAKEGEEVTISYCDVSAPRHNRRKGLKTNYNFLCDCALCQDTERDDALIGLKCAGSCNGRVRSSSSGLLSIEHTWDENKQYHCEACGYSNFEDSLKAITKLMTRIETIEADLKDDSVHDSIKYSKSMGQDLKQLFYLMSKTYCHPQTSWYVACSSDVFVHWCANALNHISDEDEQLNICHQALSVLEKSRNATKFCYDYEGDLTWLIKRGMEAKLRLFVNPVDFDAIRLVQGVRRDLMHYYPSTDEIISSLDETIRAYSYS